VVVRGYEESSRELAGDLSEKKRLIGRGYDDSAPEYLQFSDRLIYTYLARPLVDSLRAARGTVLDVASGTGALGRQLGEAVAVDLSRGQLLSNALSMRVRADAELLPFGNDSFAAVGCAFGINHFPDPTAAVREMARVAPLVCLLTWMRPEPTHFAPKDTVLQVIERHAGVARSDSGQMIEEMAEAVGSEQAVRTMLADAHLAASTTTVEVEVPWPGAAEFVDYRMSMSGVTSLIRDPVAVKEEAVAAIGALDPEALTWRPQLVLGIGRR
jgi:ubiquinone/menaquinone biosynthesis C-methylase UbiE